MHKLLGRVSMLAIAAGVLAANLVAADPVTLTGTWNMGLQGDHVIPVALVLKQDGTALTGTIALPTQHDGQRVDVDLKGEFVDGALTLSGSVPKAAEPTDIKLTAMLQEDGSLEGKITVGAHSHPWTAERLKERK